jgi:hypothetical protein
VYAFAHLGKMVFAEDRESARMRSRNIKDPKIAVSRENWETMTRVGSEALRERPELLPSRRGKAGLEELRAIAKRAAAHIK